MRLNVTPSSGAAVSTAVFFFLPSWISSATSAGGRLLPSVIGQNQHVALHLLVVSTATITGYSMFFFQLVVRTTLYAVRTVRSTVVVRSTLVRFETTLRAAFAA